MWVRYWAEREPYDERTSILEIERDKKVIGRQPKFKGGAISEKHHVPNVNLVPSERVDKNTGQPYESEMERLGFADGGGEIRQRYALGDRVMFKDRIKTALKDRLRKRYHAVARALEVPEEALDGRISEQSKKEQKEISRRLIEQGIEEQKLPSPDSIKNILNHHHLAEEYHRQQPDQKLRNKVAMTIKEIGQAYQYAGIPALFKGVKDSSADLTNNAPGYKAADKNFNKEESSLNRIDTVVDSYMRKQNNEPFEFGKDVVFFDHAENKYY